MNRRRGFTTVELMVVLVIGGVIAAAIGSVLRRQQRFFTNAATLVQRRGSLRDATAILPAEVRALAPPDGDIIAFSDSALEMHATIGAAVACDTVAGGVALDLSPVRSARPVPLAAYSTMPQAGDAARVFDGGATNAADDDAWLTLPVAAVASRINVCAASPLLDADDATAPRLRISVATGTRISSTVRPGAFVHIQRRIRYRLYRAGTGECTWATPNGTARASRSCSL